MHISAFLPSFEFHDYSHVYICICICMYAYLCIILETATKRNITANKKNFLGAMTPNWLLLILIPDPKSGFYYQSIFLYLFLADRCLVLKISLAGPAGCNNISSHGTSRYPLSSKSNVFLDSLPLQITFNFQKKALYNRIL